MFIQTETTPNPATLKFIPNQPVLPQGHPSGALEFSSAQEAEGSPLAGALFQIVGVERVFLGADFISITKSGDKEWLTLKPLLLGTIMDYFVNNHTVRGAETPSAGGCGSGCSCASAARNSANDSSSVEGEDGADGQIIAQIRDLLETRVRPALARDGGDVSFIRYDDGIVTLRMRGACSGCPSAQATLKHGIENLLRHFVPEVREVVGG